LEAINRQPTGARHDAIAAIRAFDMFIVAHNPATFPVPRNSFSWLPQTSSVDANLVTFGEYRNILRRIDSDWAPTDGEVRRRIARLIIILSFKCGLRRSEIRRLHISDLLIQASGNPSMRHLLELLIRPREKDPLKSRNAVRRICIGAMLTTKELQELKAWYDRRILQKAKMEEHLFAIPEDKLSRIPMSFFEQLNGFLRAITRYAGSGKGIHLHHMRHACHSWLFTSLILSDLGTPLPSLFPDLDETNAWLAEGDFLRRLIYRQSTATPTRKDPYTLVRCAGHADFGVTAGSYIHLFPWIVAAFLERSKLMKPGAEEIRGASGQPDTTSRRWLVEGGVHNISLQLFKKSSSATRPPLVGDTEWDGATKLGDNRASDDWLNPVWIALLRWSKNETDLPAIQDFSAMTERASALRDLTKESGPFRHLMLNWVQERGKPEGKLRLACPQRPWHTRNAVGNELISLIGNLHGWEAALLRDALGLFVVHLERGAFVRFDSIEDAPNADLYIAFLRKMKLGKQQIELVSGDPDPKSQHRRDWRATLYETNMLVSPCDNSRNYGAKSSLSIRPDFLEARTVLGTGPAGFRFAMEMAYIVFGRLADIPTEQNAD